MFVTLTQTKISGYAGSPENKNTTTPDYQKTALKE